MREDLLRFNQDQKYVFFDFETCNLNLASQANKPWQLAFIVYEKGKKVDSSDYYIKWENLNISAAAKKITGFNNKKYLNKAVSPAMVLDHFEKYLYDDSYLKCGHNILGFDIYIHNIFRKLLDRTPDYSYINQCIDTLCLARAINNSIPCSDSLLSWQLKLNSLRKRGPSATLAACCKKYEIDFDPSKMHDALYDVEKNYEVFKRQLWEVEI